MSHRELMDWYRYEGTVSPLPDKLADLHHALVCSLIVNRTRAADAEPVRMADFLVIRDSPPASGYDDGPVPADGRSEAERAAAVWRGQGGS